MRAEDWREFPQHRPPLHRAVLVQIQGRGEETPHFRGGMTTPTGTLYTYPPCVAVGYLRHAADDVGVYFVIPGVGGPQFVVTHWADVFGGEFWCPLWPGTHAPNGPLK